MGIGLVFNVTYFGLLTTFMPWFATAVTVRTVTVDQEQCGGTFVVGDKVDTYRLFVPDSSSQSNSSLDCTIRFKLNGHVSYRKRPFDYRQICVDYSRLDLKGRGTKFTLTNIGPEPNKYWLAAPRFPRLSKYADSMPCFSSRDIVVVRFQSECKGGCGYNFRSWIYVYQQPNARSRIYHIDGTCTQRAMFSQGEQMTIRSYMWKDTANEPDFQKCSVKFGTRDSGSGVFGPYFCPKWSFHETSCTMSARMQEAHLYFGRSYNDSSRKELSCETRFSHPEMNSCVMFGINNNVEFVVYRQLDISDKKQIQDGMLFFEVKAELRSERESSEVDQYDDVDDDYHDQMILKVCLPVVAVSLLVVCIFCISKRKGRTTRQNEPVPIADVPIETPEALRSVVLTDMIGRGAQEPADNISLLPDQLDSTNFIWSVGTRDGSEELPVEDRLGVPPPAYESIDAVSPHSVLPRTEEGPQRYDSLRVPFNLAVPTHDVPSVDPPAFHELFPLTVELPPFSDNTQFPSNSTNTDSGFRAGDNLDGGVAVTPPPTYEVLDGGVAVTPPPTYEDVTIPSQFSDFGPPAAESRSQASLTSVDSDSSSTAPPAYSELFPHATEPRVEGTNSEHHVEMTQRANPQPVTEDVATAASPEHPSQGAVNQFVFHF